MNFRSFIALTTALIFVAFGNGGATERPNVIMIMADDIGYECLSCYGSAMYETPNIDKLAASGIRFNHAHSQPICTPSRVQIMTGIYNNRNYIKFGLLDPEAHTFGHAMKNAGYKTMIAGKWQLGGGFEGPVKFGFDNYCLWQLTRRPSRYPNPGLEIDGKERDLKNGEFGPNVVTDYINDYVKTHKDDEAPFFVYYPMIAPHWPFVPTPDHPDWDPEMWRDQKNEPGGFKDQKYWDAMVRYTDKMVGKLVDNLDALGIRENTLVMWTGDNGTYTGVTSELDGREYKGGKGSPVDNGTHVGFVASWPGTIKAGQVKDDLVDFSDVFPTVAEIGGAKIPDTADGVSLVPLFKGEDRKKDHIYCWYERDGKREKASQHVRNQRFKVYANGKIFDTAADPFEKSPLEKNKLSDAEQSVIASLQSALDEHVKTTIASDPIQSAKRGPDKVKAKKNQKNKTKKKNPAAK